ncbi:MAG: hypothetical protein CM1200mP30_26420 [Pseudomonadota bacterium]|nr:MAG: hypothetical protein CM1200mP30_26420 [Pseudomonadota bacterium]
MTVRDLVDYVAEAMELEKLTNKKHTRLYRNLKN